MRELGAEPVVPADRRRRPERRAARTPSRGEREIGRGELVVVRHGRRARRLLLGLHAHLRHRRARATRPARSTSSSARAGRRRSTPSGPGPTARGVDAVARDLIAAAGHGEHFGHGLGHGVGLEVHEAPRLGQRSEDALEAGDVVTVEPGVYLPGELGVRIEDLVVVTEDGHRNLSGLPKDLQLVD